MKQLFYLSFLLLSPTIIGQSPLWFNTFGGIEDDGAIGVTFDSQNNVLSTGYFHNTVDFDSGAGTFELTSAGNEDIFVKKTDSDGNFLWAKSYGSNLTDQAYDIKTDANDNIYVLGSFSGTVDFNPGNNTGVLTSLGSWDVFLLKLTPSGDFIWVKHFGNSGIDYAPSLDLDSLGNIYVTGIFKNTVQFDPENTTNYTLTANGGYDFYVTKLDTNGNILFAKGFGGASYDKSRSIHINQNNEIFVSAEFKNTINLGTAPNDDSYTSEGSYDVLILKLDTNGNYLWSKHFGGTGTDHAYSLDTDPNGQIFITGTFSDIVDFDPGVGEANLSAAGTKDAYILKLNDAGVFVWAIPLTNNTEIEAFKVKYAHNSRVYIAGYFNNGITVTSAGGFNHIDAVGGDDAFICSVDENGSTLPEIFSFGGLQSDKLYGLANNEQNYIVSCGTFENQFTVNPNGSSSTNITSNGGEDAVILKLDATITGIDENSFPELQIYPNPGKNQLHIKMTSPQKISLNIYDLNGRELKRYPTEYFSKKIIPLPEQKGVYFLKITINQRHKTYKIQVK